MKKSPWSLALLLVAAAGILAPATSDACMRADYFRPKVKTKIQQVRDAEHILAKGNNKRALQKAKGLYRRDLTAAPAPDAEQDTTFDRAQRTAALATARLDGKVNVGKGLRGKTEFDQQVNVAWAVDVLRFQSARNPDNLVIRAEYAEALTHQAGMQSYAFDILNELAREDLMPTARGYALLASLQQEMGDANGRDLSITRCKELGADEPSCTVA